MQDIKDYNGLYAILKDGRVYSRKTSIFLKPNLSNGYERVGLQKEGVIKQHRVHRLVAIAYLDNPHHYPEVNHKDSNRLNNHISNLEWCNREQNVSHAYSRIRRKKEDQLLVGKLLKRGASVREIVDATKLPPSKVLNIKFNLG
jgi:hypothetical protein